MPSSPSANTTTTNSTVLFALAFRPLFLSAAIFSLITMLWWSFFWFKPFAWDVYGGPFWWHGHEMIFGFAAAVVVGFLLTAVQNWTGVRSLHGWPLASLLGLWLSGRVLIAVDFGLSAALVALVDCGFLVAAAMAMAYPVLAVKQWRNIVFAPMLLILALLNAYSHWSVLNDQPLHARYALHAAILLITVVMTIIGGRVIPMFSANGTGTSKVMPIPVLDSVSLLSVVLVAMLVIAPIFTPLAIPELIASTIYGLAFVSNSWRFLRWRFWVCWQQPLLWSLHLAYAFIPLGLLGLFLHSIGLWTNLSSAMHCFSAGAIGSLILSMMARVSLGHTGRALQVPPVLSAAFICILAAALVRVLVPIYNPAWLQYTVLVAGGLWAAAYAIFVVYYTPILCKPRIDSRPG